MNWLSNRIYCSLQNGGINKVAAGSKMLMNNLFDLSKFNRNSSVFTSSVRHYTRRLTKTPGKGYNTHRSNRAKEGLYHGKDVRSGNSISHSHHKTKRKWHPNVQNKRVWSDALDDWVRFKMTTTAMKAIDDYGGIDNYVLSLDEPSVADSRYITKMRGIIATNLYHQGGLSEKLIKKMGYHKAPPPVPEPVVAVAVAVA
jgi:ribosomal protein L28